MNLSCWRFQPVFVPYAIEKIAPAFNTPVKFQTTRWSPGWQYNHLGENAKRDRLVVYLMWVLCGLGLHRDAAYLVLQQIEVWELEIPTRTVTVYLPPEEDESSPSPTFSDGWPSPPA